MIVSEIEKTIDILGRDIIPIVDCELNEEEKRDEYGNIVEINHDDRMYYFNNPNYQTYLQEGGASIDLAYLKSLSEAKQDYEIFAYIDSHPEVLDYINYCQEKKAESLAFIYHKLHNDGYIKGNNAILYTGNKSISKDSYKATIKLENGGTYDKIVLFKYDDVVEYLTNPQSPYFISEDFNLKVWYADYSGRQNFQMLGDGAVMVQYEADVVDENGYKHDKNLGCEEYINAIANAQKNKTQENVYEITNDDDFEIG